jgi:ethanolamine-phosphate cytidylyltransferase
MSSADLDPANSIEGLHLEGDPAPELLDGRIWVDGCFDFFHHGTNMTSSHYINHSISN